MFLVGHDTISDRTFGTTASDTFKDDVLLGERNLGTKSATAP